MCQKKELTEHELLLQSGCARHFNRFRKGQLLNQPEKVDKQLILSLCLQVEKLIEHARQVSLDKQRESSSNCALFVCNKWDQVPPEETDEVKNYVVTKFTQCWPSLDPESQIIYMSAREAIEAQKLGMVTKEFDELMNSIKSMVLKSIEARLQIQWR